MKVLLLSDTSSEHTEKWARGLADKGIEIGLFSFNKAAYEWHHYERITVFFEPEHVINADRFLTKLSYIKYVSILKKIIKHFKPDILHAHYATSYGLVGALSGFRPFIISVWGSDVYDFPSRSKFHRRIFQYNLKKADALLSTSKVMMQEIQKYTNKEVLVTPFGVDVEEFSKKPSPKKQPGTFYIGTIKPIEEKYGIKYIIEAAAILVKKHPAKKFSFFLVGGGSDLPQYEKMVDDAGLKEQFVITGRIPFSGISEYHNLLDIFLNVSIDDSESFGVATVEAMACEKPVIVTDVGGLMEVVKQGEFGIVIPRKDAGSLAAAIDQLMSDPAAAKDLGKRARAHVLENYNWAHNIDRVVDTYKKLAETPLNPHKKDSKP